MPISGGMGVTSQNVSLPTPCKKVRKGAMPLPLLARGEVSGFGSLGPRFQVMGTWAQHGVPPQRDGVGDWGLPMDGEKTCGAGSQVRRLLDSARLDRRLAWTPPISMDSISSVDTYLTISLTLIALKGVSSILEAAANDLRFAVTDHQPKSLWLSSPQRSILRITLRPSF